MKIYISLPITGRDIEEVEADCIFASGVISKKGHTPVSPLERIRRQGAAVCTTVPGSAQSESDYTSMAKGHGTVDRPKGIVPIYRFQGLSAS